jgi:hypothetical protein
VLRPTGLQDLKTRSGADGDSVLSSWNASAWPCSPFEATCEPCTSPELCGTLKAVGPPPRYYCGYMYVLCDLWGSARVTAVDLSGTGLTFDYLPNSLGSLGQLEYLGKWQSTEVHDGGARSGILHPTAMLLAHPAQHSVHPMTLG